MLKRYSQTLFIASLIFVLNGCASIPNTIVCAEISLSRGVCTYTVSGETITIDDDKLYEGQTWFSLRTKSLTVPASSWAKIKAFLIKQCKKSNQCNVDVDSWDRNLNL